MVIDYFKQGTYNITLAHTLGLECSVFLSALLSSSRSDPPAIDFDNNRIHELTTFSTKKQESLMSTLKGLDLIREYEGSLHLNTDILPEYLNMSLSSKPKNIEPAKKKTKTDIIKDELKASIRTDNGELRDAYKDWIDAVYAKQGWMSKRSLTTGEDLIDSFCNHNLDTAIEIINIASIGGYRDMQWAINSYTENHKNKPTINNISMSPSRQVNLASEVF